MRKAQTATTSLGATILASWGFISWLTSSKRTGRTECQAFCISSKAICNTR